MLIVIQLLTVYVTGAAERGAPGTRFYVRRGAKEDYYYYYYY